MYELSNLPGYGQDKSRITRPPETCVQIDAPRDRQKVVAEESTAIQRKASSKLITTDWLVRLGVFSLLFHTHVELPHTTQKARNRPSCTCQRHAHIKQHPYALLSVSHQWRSWSSADSTVVLALWIFHVKSSNTALKTTTASSTCCTTTCEMRLHLHLLNVSNNP